MKPTDSNNQKPVEHEQQAIKVPLWCRLGFHNWSTWETFQDEKWGICHWMTRQRRKCTGCHLEVVREAVAQR